MAIYNIETHFDIHSDSDASGSPSYPDDFWLITMKSKCRRDSVVLVQVKNCQQPPVAWTTRVVAGMMAWASSAVTSNVYHL